MVITISFDTKRVQAWFKKIPKRLDARVPMGLQEWGNLAVTRILQQAKAVGLRQFRKSRGLFTSTRYVQNRNTGRLMIPMSGIYQDRAKPHWVSVPGNRNKPLLRSWMQQKWGKTTGSFYFTPKPFIRVGLRNAKNRLHPIVRKQVSLAIKESH